MSGNVGAGPGDITPDGCAVEFYALLPALGEPEIVHAAVPEDASILELGCGTGRILRPLAQLGHPVLGVDESHGHRPGWMPASAMSTTSRTNRSFSGAWPCSSR